MSFKLFTISTMYPGYLGSFYSKVGDLKNLSYDELYSMLLNDTTEFAGVYSRTFCRLGIDAAFVVANDSVLQSKWKSGNIINIEQDGDILFEQVRLSQPDVLWIEDLNYTDIKFLKAIRTRVNSVKLILAYHCSPIGQKILDRLKYVDFVITCTPGLKMELENIGLRSYLVYHGFDQNILNRINPKTDVPKQNFIFSGSLATGSGFHGERLELIERLIDANVDIGLFVNLESKYKISAKQFLFKTNRLLEISRMIWIKRYFPVLESGNTAVKHYSDALLRRKQLPVFGTDMYQLFRDSNIVLNYHIGVAGNYAGNMRLFEVTGVGSCLLTDKKSNLSDLFELDSEIVAYDNKEDCIAKVKWLLENEDERKKIAYAGQKRTLEFHTVESRCRLIIDIIEDELKNTKIQKMGKLNFAIIGCGRIAERHAEQISKQAKLIAVCDIEKSKADKFGKKWEAQVWYDIDKLFQDETKIDVVSICTPNGLHAEHSIKVFRKGFHVLCEKPMAISVFDCGEMIKEAEKANRRLFIVKQNRYNPPVKAIKEALEDQRLGKIFSVQLNCFWNRNPEYYTNSDWKGTMKLDGGTLYTQFSHFIDLLYWLFGDVRKVEAMTGNFNHDQIIDFEDSGVVILEFFNGIIGTINYNVNSYAKNMEGSLTIFGEFGTVKIGGQYLNELEYQNIRDFKIGNLPQGNPPNNYGQYVGSMSNHNKVYENVIEVLLNHGKIATNGFEGLKTVEIIDKIYTAAKKKL